jgi:SAM-dependent methyltransferase
MQFDTLGQAYEDTHSMPFRHHMEAATVLARLGDLRGKSVLDVGCGSGAYARLAKRMGAARVLGVDASPGMVENARWREAHEQLGIEYVCGDIADVADVGPFDVAIGVYVLPYAVSVEHLHRMCRGVAGAVTPHGRFVTLPLNPDFSAQADWYSPYGFTLQSTPPRVDGSPATLVVDFEEAQFSVTSQAWSRATLDVALREAGFAEIEWAELRPSPDGIEAHGEEFWQRYLTCPHALLVDCRK